MKLKKVFYLATVFAILRLENLLTWNVRYTTRLKRSYYNIRSVLYSMPLRFRACVGAWICDRTPHILKPVFFQLYLNVQLEAKLCFVFLLFPLRLTIFFRSYDCDIAGALKATLLPNIDFLRRLLSKKLSSFPSKCFANFKRIHYDIVEVAAFCLKYIKALWVGVISKKHAEQAFVKTSLQSDSRLPKKFICTCFNESTLKMMKNVSIFFSFRSQDI